ncbi:uncharacterized protein LAESUDRAFT_160235 [Laetiporus sulphureus 93-53]|uniref:Uncharacterized protein n=1 Tax=Laetiporus sulphureus 93-53 TaxID=1314785 RepID=A0A165HN73_9APHY|nr:uncharacterized protein LAESUDRAFT_160235 [Laetiporus sulphureus 93-53]KZT11957.1 hypothetical protein LAESUDRAFT_160235 [Laetiporus sulphureus 93-53]
MQKYSLDSLQAILRNVFDFDVYKPETIDKLAEVLDRHGCMPPSFPNAVTESNVRRLAVKRLGLDAAREASRTNILDIKFEPKGDTALSNPKMGEVDPQNKAHIAAAHDDLLLECAATGPAAG